MAKANIQTAMTMLDPDRCAQVYQLPNIMARESFRLQQDRVANFDELTDLLVRYYIHHFKAVISQQGAPTAEYARGMVWDILYHHYQGGVEAAFRAANRGINGGLAGVLDAIRDYFLKDQEDKYFSHTIMQCVDVMDLQDIKTLMEQYIQRYGRYLDGQNLAGAEFLVPKYREVIKAHSQIVRNIRTHFGR
jgi:hypothetical protein